MKTQEMELSKRISQCEREISSIVLCTAKDCLLLPYTPLPRHIINRLWAWQKQLNYYSNHPLTVSWGCHQRGGDYIRYITLRFFTTRLSTSSTQHVWWWPTYEEPQTPARLTAPASRFSKRFRMISWHRFPTATYEKSGLLVYVSIHGA